MAIDTNSDSEYVVIQSKKYGPLHYPPEEIVEIINKGVNLLVKFKVGKEIFFPTSDVIYDPKRFCLCH